MFFGQESLLLRGFSAICVAFVDADQENKNDSFLERQML
jgi:hypothetical protein